MLITIAPMARPHIHRRVSRPPKCTQYKPRGIPLAQLSEVVVTEDEMEAMRLADAEGLYHDAAAELMNVSRPTFGRIVADARKKIASAIIEGKAIRIEGGAVENMQVSENWTHCRRRGRCSVTNPADG